MVYGVYVNKCVYESERVSRLCTWCMWISVCMKVIVSVHNIVRFTLLRNNFEFNNIGNIMFMQIIQA